MSKPVKSSIGMGCGKLYLVGEYAVMNPGGLAIIAGVDRYVEAIATTTDGDTATVYSSYYGPEGRSYRLMPPANPIPVKSTAANSIEFVGWDNTSGSGRDIVAATIDMVYRVVAASGATRHALDIRIVSGLDDAVTGKKYGLGSSGAVAVAVTRAIAAAHDVELSNLEVFKIAYVATALTGAAGSGGDIACSSHGGIVCYRRPDTEAVDALIEQDALTAVFSRWPGLLIEAQADLAGLNLAVGWTGQPVKTDAQLARAQASNDTGRQKSLWTDEQNIVSSFTSEVTLIAERMWDALAADDADVVKQCIRRNRELLRAYADAKGLTIETPMLSALADSAADYGGVGKSSGAGGGDCGIALIGRGGDLKGLHAQWVRQGIEPLEVKIAPLL